MKLRTARITKVFLAVAILVVASTLFIHLVGTQVILSIRKIDGQRTVLQSLEGLISTLADAETAQRVYLLTGEEPDLEPYQHALTQVRTRQEALRGLARSGALPSEGVETVNRLTEERLARLERTIRLRREQGLTPAQAAVRSGQGKAIMDKIRAEVARLSAAEQLELDTSIRRGEGAVMTRNLAFLVTGLANLIFLWWAYRQITREIHERQAAQEELTSVAQFPEENPHPVLRLGPDAQVLYTNRAASQLLMDQGWEPGRIVPSLFWEKVQPSFQGSPAREFDFSCLQGRIFSFFCFSPPAKGYVNLYASDTTERKRAEKALAEAEERLRLMIESVKDYAIFMLDREGRVVTWNAGAQRMKQYQAHEIIGQHFSCFYPREDIAAGKPQHELAAATEVGHFTDEGWRLRKDGTHFWASVTITAVHDAAGHLRGFSKITRDLTERKQAEEALRASEIRYRRLFEAAHDGVLLLDAQTHKILDANPFIAKLLAYSAEELVGKELWEIGVLKDVEASRAVGALLEAQGHVRYEDLPLQAKTGEVLEVEFVSNLYDEDGKSIIQCNVRDITQRKRAERALAQAKDDLARTNAELDLKVQERTAKLQEMVGELEHFSYTITHDMRAPLRAMQGFGHMLLGECADCLHPQRREFIRRIADAAGRMDSLITDALNYSKIVRHELDLEPVDARALLQGMVETYPQFQPPKAEVTIEEDIPVVMGNEAGLTQCFSNLLGNAVKFVHPAIVPKVRVWAEPRGEYVRVWFEDNGIGIAKHHQDQIFIMFQKLDKSYEGTGIGLALVRKVVERMKGRTGVESEEGQGSRFWVELKRCD